MFIQCILHCVTDLVPKIRKLVLISCLWSFAAFLVQRIGAGTETVVVSATAEIVVGAEALVIAGDPHQDEEEEDEGVTGTCLETTHTIMGGVTMIHTAHLQCQIQWAVGPLIIWAPQEEWVDLAHPLIQTCSLPWVTEDDHHL